MCVSVVGRVVRASNGRAVVVVGGHTITAGTALRPETQAGDHVVVEAGLIMDIITEEEAHEIERFHREMADIFLGEATDAMSVSAHPNAKP